MDVQRFDAYGYMPSPEGKNVRYTDHARIVAEMEQAHAAALADLGFLEIGTEDYMCPNCVTPWKCNGPHIADPSYAAAPRILTADEATDKAVALLKTIGLDITYTDEGLRVVAERIGRLAFAAPRTLTADCLHLAEMYVGQSGRDNEYGRRSSVIECLACGALRLDDETVPNGVHHWYAADEVAATDGEA